MSPFLTELFKGQQYDPKNFFLIAGPCVVESEANVFEIGAHLAAVCKRLSIPLVLKASYRKANRTSASSFTGHGDTFGLGVLQKAGVHFGLPVTTDIHSEAEADAAAGYVDILQIPAFLCRQTELLNAAARTGKIVNVKKGQFLNGPSMKFAADKIRAAGNDKVILTERGTTFGYQDLVVDFRNIPWMQESGAPVVMDVTHSLQQPNQAGGVTGGNPQLIGTIAKAAIATGADGLFIETHPDPACALSDGANMLRLDLIEGLLEQLVRLRQAVMA
ncbi:MAG: 3-deoxy-8-phosphooctulonate synthase [Chitinophagaceae bacterium]|nr:MAG: 3-deoxy-8-phosphooctulonate synthase [Chitinophagaceae bacterium]